MKHDFRRDGGPADNLSSPATRGPDDGGVAQLLQKDCPGNLPVLRIRDVYPGSRANFQRIIELLTQKIVNKLSKIWVWNPRFGIRKKPIPDPGVKKAPDPGPGSGSPTL